MSWYVMDKEEFRRMKELDNTVVKKRQRRLKTKKEERRKWGVSN